MSNILNILNILIFRMLLEIANLRANYFTRNKTIILEPKFPAMIFKSNQNCASTNP